MHRLALLASRIEDHIELFGKGRADECENESCCDYISELLHDISLFPTQPNSPSSSFVAN